MSVRHPQRTFTAAMIFAALLPLSIGCAPRPRLVDPARITLDDALKGVLHGLAAMRAEQKNLEGKAGLLPTEAEVTFILAAKATDTNRLYVELGAPASAPVSGKLGGEATRLSEGSRQSQIRLKFTSLLLADEKTLVAKRTPKQLQTLQEELENAGFQVHLQ